MWISTNRLHLHGLAAPAKKKETAWYAMNYNVECIHTVNLTNKTIGSQAARER